MPLFAHTLSVDPPVTPLVEGRPDPVSGRPDLLSRMPDVTPRELLVALREPADLTGALMSAAARARATHRPLSVVIVEPARGWTIDTAVIALQDRRRSREIASMTAAARVLCSRVGVEVCEVLVLRPGWEWTRRGRNRAVEVQLRAIARRRGADLHGADLHGPGPHGPHNGEPRLLVGHDITGRPLAAGPHRTAPCPAGSATVAGPAAGGDVAVGAR